MKPHLAILLALLLLSGCASIVKTASPAPPVKRPQQGIYHVVKTGENLFRIGKAYGVSHEELARHNGIRDAGQIFVGQRIFVPGASGQLPVEIITPSDPVRARAPPAPEPFEPMRNGFLWPVSGTINSVFGPRGSSFHDGVDIAAPEGTPIRVIEGGEVIYSDQLKGYGNIVIVRHAEGLVSVYAHNEANLVRQGQLVGRGEMIARVGSTGRVTGPHLHFEIRKNNAAQDPVGYLPQLCCLPPSDTVAPKG
jgi:murein DD-endopeptidase MepM/ murein hydrolase activator NlpD